MGFDFDASILLLHVQKIIVHTITSLATEIAIQELKRQREFKMVSLSYYSPDKSRDESREKLCVCIKRIMCSFR